VPYSALPFDEQNPALIFGEFNSSYSRTNIATLSKALLPQNPSFRIIDEKL
tara:strand:+ start:515 stop:667 length:153 start_codon:yes stop_codon:yes gene_type:complete